MSNEKILLQQSLEQRRLAFAPDQSINKFFEYFSAECILYEMNIGADKIQQGNVDGGGDGGIDLFYCFLNDDLVGDKDKTVNSIKNRIDLYLIQTKYTDGFQGTAVQKIIESLKIMLNLSNTQDVLKRRFRDKLLKKIVQFRDIWSKISLKPYAIHIHIYYCANADEVHPNVRDTAATVQSELSVFGSVIKPKVHFIGAKQLIELAHRISRIECATLELTENPLNTKQGGYIAVTSLENYYQFITEENRIRHALFDTNVRDYQGSTDVNISIKTTLGSDGHEDFWWLNNGVSVIASGVRSSNKVLTLDFPQIVNGLQTSYEIFKSIASMSDETKRKNILIRVVEIPLENRESRDKIIRATNSQTQLPPSSFRSTEDIHRYIESFFKENNLFYDRRRSFYSNMGVKKDQIVSIEFLVQCVTAIIMGSPYKSREQEDIYSSNNPLYPKIFDNLNLKTYLNCVLLVKICERYAIDRGFKYGAENMRFYLAYTIAGVTVKSVAIKDSQMNSMNLTEIDAQNMLDAYNTLNQQFIARYNFQHSQQHEDIPDLTGHCKTYINQTIGSRIFRLDNQ